MPELAISLLQQLSNGQQLISQFHVTPMGAERSRTYDGGIEQSLFEDGPSLEITYFHNEFTHGVEFVPMQGLIDLGVPQPIAQALQFGSTVIPSLPGAGRRSGTRIQAWTRPRRSRRLHVPRRSGATFLYQ